MRPGARRLVWCWRGVDAVSRLLVLRVLCCVCVYIGLLVFVSVNRNRGHTRSSAKIGTIQRRLAWPLRKDDTHKSRTYHTFLGHRHQSCLHSILPPMTIHLAESQSITANISTSSCDLPPLVLFYAIARSKRTGRRGPMSGHTARSGIE